MRGIKHFWQRSITLATEPLHDRVGCTWRDSAVSESHHGGEPAVPHGFVRYRQQMARAGAPLSFRVAADYSPLKLCVRFGCLGAVAMSGKFAAGGIVTSSNPLICGNKSGWWGFSGRKNVDGIVREYAGPELARECDALSPVGPDGQRLLPCTVRATGAHSLKARKVLHAAGPTSPFPRANASPDVWTVLYSSKGSLPVQPRTACHRLRRGRIPSGGRRPCGLGRHRRVETVAQGRIGIRRERLGAARVRPCRRARVRRLCRFGACKVRYR